jgi:HEAT repeat protein
MVSAVNRLAAEIPQVSVNVVNANESPELTDRYQVRSVPTTVINEGLTIIGVVTREELVRRALESMGPAGDDAVLKSLVESGRIEDATAYLVHSRGLTGFAELWNESALEARIGLSLVAQNAIDESPTSLDSLVDLILPSLDGDDSARRGDTADLLGIIGHESARPALEKLLEDEDEDIAEVAQDALGSIAERSAEADSR